MIFLSLLFFVLAAACNAVCDTLQFHYYKCVFKDLFPSPKKQQFWNPTVSWENKYIDHDPEKGLRKWLWFDVPFTDGWHTFKSLMIVFVCLSIVTFKPLFNWWIDFTLFGLVWNLIFNLFYNKILLKK